MEKITRSLTLMSLAELKAKELFIRRALDVVNEKNCLAPLLYSEVKEFVESGSGSLFYVNRGEGLMLVTASEGFLYVYFLTIFPGAEKNILKKVGGELLEFAEEKGLNGVRFRTERKGMIRSLSELGYKITAFEITAKVGG